MTNNQEQNKPSASPSKQQHPSTETCQATTLSLNFDLHLYPRQISRWRGAVAQSSGYHPLFHNHRNETAITEVPPADSPATKRYDYRYPLIQYRSQQGKAALFGINKGAEALRQWVMQTGGKLNMGGRNHDLRLIKLEEEQWNLQMLPRMATYRLMDWTPLNQDNYQKWRTAKNLAERVALLDRILVGNLLSLSNGLNWQLPQRLEASLWHIRSTKKVRVHRDERMAFNVLFKANIDLPDGMALGRNVAFGFGVLKRCGEG